MPVSGSWRSNSILRYPCFADARTVLEPASSVLSRSVVANRSLDRSAPVWLGEQRWPFAAMGQYRSRHRRSGHQLCMQIVVGYPGWKDEK